VPEERRLPRGRLLGAAEAQALLPGLARGDVTGAALWYDALAENTERLTLSLVMSAEAAQAAVANYVRARRLMVEGGAVQGVEVEDVRTGGTFVIRARAVINAAGPWLEQPWAGVPQRFPLVGAWNLVLRKPLFGAYGVGLESLQEHRDRDALVQRGKRNLFFVPWRGGTMVGTVYEPFEGDPSAYRPRRAAVASFLDEINRVYPPAALAAEDVTLVHVGVQPGPPAGGDASVEPDKHSEVVQYGGARGPRGLLSIKGVKFTTGLGVGRRAARLAARTLGRMDAPPDEVSLYGGEHMVEPGHVEAWAKARQLTLSPGAAQRLATQYGTRAEFVLDLACADRAAPVPGAPDALLAEVRHATQFEHAVSLSDVFLRRTEWGSAARPSPETVRAVREEMARELGWSPDEAMREERDLDAAYDRVAP
jgi:glycerol-3-phosphate dehydrogenase